MNCTSIAFFFFFFMWRDCHKRQNDTKKLITSKTDHSCCQWLEATKEAFFFLIFLGTTTRHTSEWNDKSLAESQCFIRSHHIIVINSFPQATWVAKNIVHAFVPAPNAFTRIGSNKRLHANSVQFNNFCWLVYHVYPFYISSVKNVNVRSTGDMGL